MTNSKTPTVQEMFLNIFDNRNLFQPEKRVISLHKLEDEASFTRPLSCQRRRSLPIWLWLELRPQNGRVHLGLWKIEGDGQDKRHQINPSHKHVRFGQRWWIWGWSKFWYPIVMKPTYIWTNSCTRMLQTHVKIHRIFTRRTAALPLVLLYDSRLMLVGQTLRCIGAAAHSTAKQHWADIGVENEVLHPIDLNNLRKLQPQAEA